MGAGGTGSRSLRSRRNTDFPLFSPNRGVAHRPGGSHVGCRGAFANHPSPYAVTSWGDGPSAAIACASGRIAASIRSEEHTSELQSLMRISYAVFCLKKKKDKSDEANITDTNTNTQLQHQTPEF